MVLPHREGAGVVGPLVERREHVVVAADVAQVVVVLVGDLVAVGKVARREMVAVGDLDGRRVVVDEPGEWPGIVVPITLFCPPSHQSQTDWPAPMSVELWTAAMPPPFWT